MLKNVAMENGFAKSRAYRRAKPICVTAYPLHNIKIRFYPRIFRAIRRTAKQFCLYKFVEPDSENSTNSRKIAFSMRRGVSMPKYRSTILLVCLLAIGGLTGFA